MKKQEEDKKIVSGLTANYNQPETIQVNFESNQNWGPGEEADLDDELQRKRQ